MTRALANGDKVRLSSSGKITDFKIEEKLGEGGSCVAYRVTFKEGEEIVHSGVLKEFCPAYLTFDGEFSRDGTTLVIPEGVADEFTEGKANFKAVYRNITKYLADNPSAQNNHPVQLGLYEGNNTFYTLASLDYGENYDQMSDSGLLSVLQIALSTVKAVEMYHRAGFLHLDIKPQNIFILDGVRDLVKLFDYDSLTRIDDVKNRRVRTLPCPGEYYVPELASFRLINVGIQTDIFEIGMMLYIRIFGDSPDAREIMRGIDPDIDAAPLLTGISPGAKHELLELFKKTIQISPVCRYKTTADLKTQLEKIIKIVDGDEPYVMNMPKWQPSSHRVGRFDELKEVKRRLDTDGYVFIKGMGGLGKSELAKLFAKEYASGYHTVQFCKYTDSLKALTAELSINGINDSDYTDYDQLVIEKNKILHSADCHTLLIVDNYNEPYDAFMREFLPSSPDSFKVIFTTRCTQAADYYKDKTYDLPPLSDAECRALFAMHSHDVSGGEEDLSPLMDFAEGNTLVIILMASAMKKNGFSVSKMSEALDVQKLDKIEAMIFHEYDYSDEETKAYNKLLSHLNSIFSVSGLDSSERELMKGMSLIPMMGIDVNEFLSYCEGRSFDVHTIYKLAGENWIKLTNDNIISLHPTVSDLVAWNESIKKVESHDNLAKKLIFDCLIDSMLPISMYQSKLDVACHLERRYINNDSELTLQIYSCKCYLYICIFRFKDAKRSSEQLLDKAKELSMYHYIGEAYSNLGEVERKLGTPTQAIEYYKKAYDIWKTDDNIGFGYRKQAVWTLRHIAECYKESGSINKSIEFYNRALEIAKEDDLYDQIHDIAAELSELCIYIDKSEDAAVYKALCEKYGDLANPKEKGAFAISGEFILNREYERAISSTEEYLKNLRDKVGEDSPLYMEQACFRWGTYIAARQMEQGLRLLSESLEYIKKTYGEDSLRMAEELTNVASFLPGAFEFNPAMKSEFDYAIRSADRAIEICEKLGEYELPIKARAIAAKVICMLIVKDNAAIENALKSIDIDALFCSGFFEMYIGSVAFALFERSRYDEAEQLCRYYISRNYKGDYAGYQSNIVLAFCEIRRGNLKTAKEYIDRAKVVVDSIESEKRRDVWLVLYYRVRAQLYASMRDYKTALNELDKIDTTLNNVIAYAVSTEKAFYNTELLRYNEAFREYEKCEKWLDDNNMPKEWYIQLYNNISIIYSNQGNYTMEKEYLDKIVEMTPEVLTPKNYDNAVVCGNIGFNAHHLGDSDKGIKLMERSLCCLKSIGSHMSPMYFTNMHNIASVYYENGNCKMVLKLSDKLYKLLEQCNYDEYGTYRRMLYRSRIKMLFRLNKDKKAYKFAISEAEHFKKRFGADSLCYMDVCSELGRIFKERGQTVCGELFLMALDAVESGGHYDTVECAILLNGIGVYHADILKDYDKALTWFDYAKNTFERIGETDHILYPQVNANIDGIKRIQKNT